MLLFGRRAMQQSVMSPEIDGSSTGANLPLAAKPAYVNHGDSQRDTNATESSQEIGEKQWADEWRNALSRSPSDDSAWQSVLAQVARADSVLAMRFAAKIVEYRPEVAQIAYAAVLDTLAQRGEFTAATLALAQISNGEMKSHLVTNLALQWGRENPMRAIEWLQSLSSDLNRREAFVAVSRIWAEGHPEQAANFALNLPAGELRRDFLAAALTSWVEKNPGAATAWIDQLNPQPDLDSAAARIARIPSLIQTRVDVALGWAESISDGNERIMALDSIVALWADRDRPAAIAYIQNSPALTAAQKATLLEEVGVENTAI